MIRTLIWDADGTLFNTYPPIYRSVELAMAAFNAAEPRAEIVRLAQIDMSTCFTTLSDRHKLAESDLISEYWKVRIANPSDECLLFAGVRDLCEWFLEQGGRHYIVTHRDRPSLLRLLAHNDCAAWFTDIVTDDDGYPRKPDPTGLLALIERNGIEKDTALYVGDRELDIKAGHNAGIRACQYGTALTNTMPEMKITQYQQFYQALMMYNK